MTMKHKLLKLSFWSTNITRWEAHLYKDIYEKHEEKWRDPHTLKKRGFKL